MPSFLATIVPSLTVAIVESLLVQIISFIEALDGFIVALIFSVWPTIKLTVVLLRISAVGLIFLTVTEQVAFLLLLEVTVILVVPSFWPVTFPVSSTVAIDSSLLVQIRFWFSP